MKKQSKDRKQKKEERSHNAVRGYKEIYSDSWRYIKESKNYIFFAFFIFLGLAIFGYFFPNYFVAEIEQFIKELIEKTRDFTTIQMISYLFLNNSWSAFVSILFGILLGIIPLFSAIANGYLVGFVSNRVIAESSWIELWRLLPHGIFEIPAIIIALGLGMKIGTVVFHKGYARKELSRRYIESIRVFFYILLPLLIIAAIIEGILIGVFS